MKRNRNNDSNILGNNVHNNLIRNYYLQNNTVNINKKVKKAPDIQRMVFFFTIIYDVELHRLK